MKETWQPGRTDRIARFSEPVMSLIFVGLLLYIADMPWEQDGLSIGQVLFEYSFMLPVVAVFVFQLATECYRLYLISHRRMFSWSITFDGDALRILRPDENPLVIRKSDCARLYPITGTLILRDERAVHLCTPDERFVHCEKRLRWLEQWWPGLRRIALETNSGTRTIQLQIWLGSALVALFLLILGSYAIEAVGEYSIEGLSLIVAIVVAAYLVHKTLYWTDWYQQPIDLDGIAQDTGHDTAVRSPRPNA